MEPSPEPIDLMAIKEPEIDFIEEEVWTHAIRVRNTQGLGAILPPKCQKEPWKIEKEPPKFPIDTT